MNKLISKYKVWSLYYRSEIVLSITWFLIGLAVGLILFIWKINTNLQKTICIILKGWCLYILLRGLKPKMESIIINIEIGKERVNYAWNNYCSRNSSIDILFCY